MKLYYTTGACSLAVRILINELNITCEYVKVDLKEKRTENHEDYLKISVKGAVPALEIRKGEVLTEVAVILQYLADNHDDFQLLPKVTDIKRYRVLEWVNYIATELHKGFGPLFKPDIPSEYKNNFVIPNIKQKLSFVDQHIKLPFLMGEQFSLADAYFFVILNWMNYFKIDKASWNNLNKYYQTLLARKSIHESLEQEKLLVKA